MSNKRSVTPTKPSVTSSSPRRFEKTLTRASSLASLDYPAERVGNKDFTTNKEYPLDLELRATYARLREYQKKLEDELSKTIGEPNIQKSREARVSISTLKSGATSVRLFGLGESNQLTPERLEVIKMQVVEDIENYYRDQLTRTIAESTNSREENSRLRQEISRLNTELERERAENQLTLSKNKMLYEAEVANLRHVKDELATRVNRISEGELNRQKEISAENALLQTKCTLLTNDLEETKKKFGAQVKQLIKENRSLKKSCTELKVVNQELEADRNSLRNQLRILQGEFENVRNEANFERQRANDAIRSSNEAESRLNDLTQKTRKELTTLRLDAQQQRSELEKQRDDFMRKSQELESQISYMANQYRQTEQSAARREMEVTERESRLRDSLSAEVVKLETQVAALSQRLKQAEEQVEEANLAKKAAEIRTLELDERINELTDQIKRPKEEWEEISRLEAELLQTKKKLADVEKAALEHHSELRSLPDKLEEGNPAKSNLGDEPSPRLSRVETLLQMERKAKKQLEDQLNSVRGSLTQFMTNSSRRKKSLCNRMNKMKEHARSREAEIMRLRAENELLRRNVPKAQYEELRMTLEDLRQRHKSYASLLLGTSSPSVPGDSGENFGRRGTPNRKGHRMMSNSVSPIRVLVNGSPPTRTRDGSDPQHKTLRVNFSPRETTSSN
ncbi:unnamed protein product [Calicophoron daubneyi]|uniref:Uncharacterized protein n=1 Tax=Calicophoron daubneyi TaxID=300641 RepID=A0AAV2TH01_CALDB